jgi:hypothetical protein
MKTYYNYGTFLFDSTSIYCIQLNLVVFDGDEPIVLVSNLHSIQVIGVKLDVDYYEITILLLKVIHEI